MKKYVFIISTCFLFLFAGSLYAQPAPKEGHMEALLIAVTDEPGIGSSVQVSLKRAITNTKALADALNLSYNVTVLRGQDVTPAKVRKATRDMAAKQRPAGAGKHVGFVMTFVHGINYQNPYSVLPWILAKPNVKTVNGDNDPALISTHQMYDKVRSGDYDHVHFAIESCNGVGLQSYRLDPMPGFSPQLKRLMYSVKSSIMSSSIYGRLSWTGDHGGPFSNSYWEAMSLVAQGQLTPKFEGAGGFFEYVIEATHKKQPNQIPQGFVEDVPLGPPSPGDGGNTTTRFDINSASDIVYDLKNAPEVSPPAKKPGRVSGTTFDFGGN